MDEVIVRIRVSIFSCFRVVMPERTEMEWARVRIAIERAIAPFAGAYEAVVRALEELAGDP
jgi:hypothetical protein